MYYISNIDKPTEYILKRRYYIFYIIHYVLDVDIVLYYIFYRLQIIGCMIHDIWYVSWVLYEQRYKDTKIDVRIKRCKDTKISSYKDLYRFED